MATETRSLARVQNPVDRLQHGVGGGLVAGLAMGLLVQLVLGRMTAIGALYTLGDPSLTVGWVAHLFHSVLFGALFAVAGGPGLVEGLAARSPVGDSIEGYPAGLIGGLAFATALWTVNIVFVWPVWLGTVGLGGPSVPNLAVQPLVGHLVYGAILGVVVVSVRPSGRKRTSD
jgi:two-component system OmpR family sensor kinase